MDSRIKNIRICILVFCSISPILIRLNWISKTEVLILSLIQFSALILAMMPELNTKSKFLDSSNNHLRKNANRTLRLVVGFSTILFSIFLAGNTFDSKTLILRKLSLSSGLIYVEHTSNWSDNYYTIRKFKIFSQDKLVRSIWSDNYEEMKFEFEKVK